MQDRKYKKLHRGSYFTFGVATVRRSSLWLAEDHLLQAMTSYFHESYRRFYFRDIQAILVAPNGTYKAWNISLIVTAFFCLLLAVAFGGSAWGFFGFLIVADLIGLGINLFRGPTCSCMIQTAVQVERLRALSRLRVAQRTVGQLTPLIAEAQRELSAIAAEASEPGPVRLSRSTPTSSSKPAPHPASPGKSVSRRPGMQSYVIHRLLFGTVIGASALILLQSLFQNVLLIILISITLVVALVLSVIGLTKYYRRLPVSRLAIFNWGILVYLAALILTGYSLLIGMAIRHPEAANNAWRQLKLMAEIDLTGSAWLVALSFTCTGIGFILGLGGMTYTRRNMNHRKIHLRKHQSKESISSPLTDRPPEANSKSRAADEETASELKT